MHIIKSLPSGRLFVDLWEKCDIIDIGCCRKQMQNCFQRRFAPAREVMIYMTILEVIELLSLIVDIITLCYVIFHRKK